MYAEGAKRGAPRVRQIADRYHLLVNLRDTLKDALAGHQDILPVVQGHGKQSDSFSHEPAQLSPAAPTKPVCEVAVSAPTDTSKLTAAQPRRQISRANRCARYQQILALSRETQPACSSHAAGPRRLENADHASQKEEPAEDEGGIDIWGGEAQSQAADGLANGQVGRDPGAKERVAWAQEAENDPGQGEQDRAGNGDERKPPGGLRGWFGEAFTDERGRSCIIVGMT